jgi:hypothetical protein
MKKQNGFISSSSSVSICYTTSTASQVNSAFEGYNGYYDISATWSAQTYGTPYTEYTKLYETYNPSTNYSWKTYASTSYMRIEYFLEAIETIGKEYSRNAKTGIPLSFYSRNVAYDDLYNGFVDVVITFPTFIRLAGIELVNPWVNKLMSDDASYWRYLPSKFSIYRVASEKVNEALEQVTYENDVACVSDYAGKTTIRPVRYDSLENDANLMFLGNYEVSWENKASYKCFFKFNSSDPASVNLINDANMGTATWECKQIVLRIYETSVSSSTKNINVPGKNYTYIEEKIREYILEKELAYGTKYVGVDPTIDTIGELIGLSGISSASSFTGYENWQFGSSKERSYASASDVEFSSGIEYKLGGIQLLLSPDIFSISEMKMYDYASNRNNKVYVGQWNPDLDHVEYYGAKTIKTSPFIDINPKTGLIKWNHSFNIPPKYLDAKMYIRFKLDYDSFSVGDVVANVVNIQGNPISMKMTGSTIEVNLSNGIGFTNPTTGEFLSFQNGLGIQMDRPGNYDALNAARAAGATIEDAGSSVAAKIEGDCPFQVYFVIKRLF